MNILGIDDEKVNNTQLLDFVNIIEGLKKIGFNESEVDLIAGLNWLKFFEKSFGS